jgi:hypothetical protein
MLHKAILTLLAVTVIGFAAATSAVAHGGGAGDFPAVGYPFLFVPDYQPNCHIVQRRVLTRYGWRHFSGRLCR